MKTRKSRKKKKDAAKIGNDQETGLEVLRGEGEEGEEGPQPLVVVSEIDRDKNE